MRLVAVFSFICFIFLVFTSHAEARTRAPKTENERSLLYWRYLCENQPQNESIKTDHSPNAPIELACASQGWKVYSDGDLVREVVEDAKK